MTSRPAPFRQADLSRAIKAATSAGLEIVRVEIEALTGKIVIITAREAPDQGNPLDNWLGRHAS